MSRTYVRGVAVTVGVVALSTGLFAKPARAQTVDEMRAQLQIMQRRIEQLEAADRVRLQGKTQVRLPPNSQPTSQPRTAQAQATPPESRPATHERVKPNSKTVVASAPVVAAENNPSGPLAENDPGRINDATPKVAVNKEGELVRRGALPGSFLIPGTDTSIRFGGYVKVDALYDIGAPQFDQILPAVIPLNVAGVAGNAARRNDGNFRLHARQSRLNFATATPTIFGPATTVVEADFFGDGGGNSVSTNSYNFRLRLAFLELGPFGFGQYWSLFEDTLAFAETLDFNGPIGAVFVRQPQFRFVYDTKKYGAFGFSVETAEPDFFGSTNGVAGAIGGPGINSGPDLVARYTYAFPYGHVFLAGVGRRTIIDNGLLNTAKPGYYGYGLNLAGSIEHFYGKDAFFYQAAGGNGIGRYLNGNQVPGLSNAALTTGLTTANPTANVQASVGLYVGYQHWWSEVLRSNVVYGRQHNSVDARVAGPTSALIAPGLNRSLETLHANLIWSPIPRANIGIEYIYDKRVTNQGLRGDDNRIQASVQYGF